MLRSSIFLSSLKSLSKTTSPIYREQKQILQTSIKNVKISTLSSIRCPVYTVIEKIALCILLKYNWSLLSSSYVNDV